MDSSLMQLLLGVNIMTKYNYCRFHGWCRDKGYIKKPCEKVKAKDCKRSRKFEDDMSKVRMGLQRDIINE